MNKIYDNEWQRNDGTITIKKDFFEHLLNCLANQKFIDEPPSNGDAIAMEEEEYNKVQREGQEAIDKAWRQGMFIMSLEYKMNEEYQKKIHAHVDLWNESIPEIMKNRDDDIREFSGDSNIAFKWQHLVDQEIVMWIRLCCFSQSTIDVENERYEIGQVEQKDFDGIVERRGFTPKMISFLLKTLKYIGIGNNLKTENL